jgi:hypothetical protein
MEYLPVDKALPIISSSNSSVLKCDNVKSCIALSPGSANVTVSFPSKNNTASLRILSPEYNFGFGLIDIYTIDIPTKYQDKVSRPYSFPSITYTITVTGTPNTPHISTCTTPTNITKDSATVNWSYTDADNNPQTQYQVQLSKKSFSDPTFSTSTDVAFSGIGTNATSHTFTGLTPNTTYYSRVRTYNITNAWSVYSSCASSFTTLIDPTTPAPTCACNNTRTLTCTTDGTITSTTPNSSQCAFSSYCSVSTTTTNTTFNFGPAGNRIGGVKYEHASGISVTKNGPVDYSYIYSIPKVNGTQSLTVTSTDLSDSSSDTKTCSVTNSPTTTPSTTTSTTTPKITITKTPKITLNKGGTCTLDWNITDRSSDMTCILSGTDNTTTTLPDSSSGTSKSGPLQQNTKYTIKCTGDTPTKNVSASTICRVNPSVNEI